jgi:hypothetical protein
VPGAVFSFHDAVQFPEIKNPLIRFRIDFLFTGSKNQIDRPGLKEFEILRQIPGVGLKILLVIELCGIYKYADNGMTVFFD